jgi:alpha-tubulin suppressor-like RCC1 family protein
MEVGYSPEMVRFGKRAAACLITLMTSALLFACEGGAGFGGPGTTPAPSGNAWTWGGFTRTPEAMSLPSGVRFTTIAGGRTHLVALDGRGHAWEWGLTSTMRTPTPVAVSMLSGVTFTAVAAGGAARRALDRPGRAGAWGGNMWGQLGTGNTANSANPIAVNMPAGVSFTAIVAGGLLSLALDTTGQVWAWGYNRDGELGDATTTDSPKPVSVRMPRGVHFTAIAAGTDFGVALDPDGRAWSWGYNATGELGIGSTGAAKTTPVEVSTPQGVRFNSIAAETNQTVALDSNGQAWTWGTSLIASLGNNMVATKPSPVQVAMPAGIFFTTIAAGADHSLALDRNGHGWAWGLDDNSQLGDGKSKTSSSPVAVTMPTGIKFTAIAATSCCSFALS